MKRALLICSLLASSCCDSGAPPAPSYFLLESKYYLRPDAVSGVPTRLANGANECAEDGTLSICTSSDSGAIWVEFRNGSTSAQTLDWPRAVWVDERGGRSAVDVAPTSMAAWPPNLVFTSEPEVVESGETRRALVWPRGKVYYVHESCRNVALFHEPLVPRHLSGNPQTDESVADAMYAEGRSVELVVPVTGPESREIRISFVLATPEDLTEEAD